MSLKVLISIITIMTIANNCDSPVDYEPQLFLKRISFSDPQIRLDGYYYFHSEIENAGSEAMFFYNNGILFNCGGFDPQNQKSFELNFVNEKWLQGISKYRLTWGIVSIKNDSIFYEKYYPAYGDPYASYIRSGTILNDTSFLITKSYRMTDGVKADINELEELYLFKKYLPKPDSTNTFIE